MKPNTLRTFFSARAFAALIAAASLAPATASAQTRGFAQIGGQPSVQDLGWMAGSWRAEANGQIFEETWLPPRDGVMVGVGRTVDAAGQVYVSFMVIETRPKGVFLKVVPGTRGAWVDYAVSEASEERLVAENPKKDMPRVFNYINEGEDMVERQTGQIGPTPLGTEFRFRRVLEEPAEEPAAPADPSAPAATTDPNAGA